MIEKIKNKMAWLFSSHYKMERFGVMFLVLALAMTGTVGSILAHKKALDDQAMGTQAVYTTAFSMSLTGLSGSVVDVYTNTDHTKVFVLLKWNDPTKIVTDASEYELFYTGSDLAGNKVSRQSSPSASIYLFGSTGYMGIYFVDTNGFPAQIVNMTLRCNKMIAPLMTEIPSYNDQSFAEYDQVKIYFNPGGSGSTVAKFLDEDRMGIYDVCEGTMIAGQEDELRVKLDTDLVNMEAALMKIQEYERRVRQDAILPPDAPIQIRNDKIITDEDGNKSLETGYMLPGGYDFDWRNGSILEGYLDKAIPDGYAPSQHLTTSAQLAQSDNFKISNLTWMNADGTVFTGKNPQNLTAINQANSDIQLLQTAWTEYYNAKKAYQTVDLAEMLKLELYLRDVMENFSIKTDDTITLW